MTFINPSGPNHSRREPPISSAGGQSISDPYSDLYRPLVPELSDLRAPTALLNPEALEESSTQSKERQSTHGWLKKAFGNERHTLKSFAAASVVCIACSSTTAFLLGRAGFSAGINSLISTIVDYAAFYGTFVPLLMSKEKIASSKWRSKLDIFFDKVVEVMKAAVILEVAYPIARFSGQLIFQNDGFSPFVSALGVTFAGCLFNGLAYPIIRQGMSDLNKRWKKKGASEKNS